MRRGLRSVHVADDNYKEFLPKSYSKATPLAAELRLWATGDYEGRTVTDYGHLRSAVDSLSVTLVDELDGVFSYAPTEKGNLSLAKLVKGASSGYGSEVLNLLDSRVKDEIDQAGKCLAYAMFTACGFHILRSVEIGIKGYVHAATGTLPAVRQRSWGEYINVLNDAGAARDLIDLLRILKTKRNPLMHPQDSLDEHDAIDILCICQSVMGALTREIKSSLLEAKFAASLARIPTFLGHGMIGVTNEQHLLARVPRRTSGASPIRRRDAVSSFVPCSTLARREKTYRKRVDANPSRRRQTFWRLTKSLKATGAHTNSIS